MVFRAGDQKIVQGEFYLFRIIPDESCDKTFDPFEIKIKFPKETAAWFVTDEYKNVTSVYPSLLYREDSGWMEFSSNSGSFWGMVGGGTEGADLTFYVVGLTDNLASLFKNIVALEPEPVPEPEPEPEPIQAADYDTTYYYYYGLLDDKEKVIYTQVSEALNACEKEVSLAYPISNEDFHDLFWYVLSDQPQVFWTNRSYYPSYSGGLVTKVRLDYNELADNLASEQAKVESVVQKILTSVNGMNQTQAERYIHDFLIKETIYNLGCPHNQNIYSILVNKETVCAGYARAFQYLMQRIGIPCYYCYGYIGTMDDPGWHAWNVIRINGECYNVDVTWDDWYGETDQELSYVSYEFYNVTDSYISVEHHRYSYGLLLPDCHMMSYSFENLYGHNWPTEVAMELGIPVVDDLEDYYTLFYNVLNATGIGTAETAFIVTNPATFDDIRNQIEYKGFEEGYWKRIVSEKGYNNKILYDWEWTSGRWLGSHREGVYLVQKDTVEYR
ncbi:MAG: hypothetical protein IJM83_06090 [Firmicutes bacterium]|nr:hypothetical protein [Bacillota bacterium]